MINNNWIWVNQKGLERTLVDYNNSQVTQWDGRVEPINFTWFIRPKSLQGKLLLVMVAIFDGKAEDKDPIRRSWMQTSMDFKSMNQYKYRNGEWKCLVWYNTREWIKRKWKSIFGGKYRKGINMNYYKAIKLKG